MGVSNSLSLSLSLFFFLVGVDNMHYPEGTCMHIEYTTCDSCDIFNNVQRACCHLIICILFQNGNGKLKGIHQEFKRVYLGQMNISLLSLPSVEQEGIFTASSVHMEESSKNLF